MFTFHTRKTFFLAPYLAKGYIIDSINREKGQHSYLLTSIIDEAFGFLFLWEMVKCKQQKNGWECSFMIIKHMHEFVNSIQHDFPIKLWNEKGFLPQKEIDKLSLRLNTTIYQQGVSNGSDACVTIGKMYFHLSSIINKPNIIRN
ncbi:hypothetical protein Hanom_Chr12g01159681 [Helianthus anomalus]